MAPRFKRREDGAIEARLTEVEADTLRRVAEDLLTAIDSPDEGFRRLFPPAYPDDDDAQEQFESLTRDELVEAKKAAARAVVDAIERGQRRRDGWLGLLDPPTAESLLGILNDARLVLGTRLDVSEEMASRPLPDDDPRAPATNLYLFLGGTQELLVEAMSLGLVPGNDEDG